MMSDSRLASQEKAIEVAPVWAVTLVGGEGGGVVSGVVRNGV